MDPSIEPKNPWKDMVLAVLGHVGHYEAMSVDEVKAHLIAKIENLEQRATMAERAVADVNKNIQIANNYRGK